MFEIPKFAEGGLLTPPQYYIGDTVTKPLRRKFIDKYYMIYKRTKKARIKKKAAKKSWILNLEGELEKPITIIIGGKENEKI